MNIIVPKKEFVIPTRYTMAGRFRFQVIRPDGRIRKDTGWFDNLITDWGLNKWGTRTNIHLYCHVGEGSSAPVVANTQLDSWKASIEDSGLGSGGRTSSPPYYAWRRNGYRFPAGAAAGNLTEVGVGPNSGSTDDLFSRALILDAGGSPTSITVLADEVLDVFYEFRMYPPTTDATYTVSDGGVTYSITVRAAGVTSASYWQIDTLREQWFAFGDRHVAYDGPINASITGTPSGSSSNADGGSNVPYSNNSLTLEGTQSYSLDKGNFATGIKSILFSSSGMGGYQAEFDPVIDKDNTKVLDVGIKGSWGRASI